MNDLSVFLMSFFVLIFAGMVLTVIDKALDSEKDSRLASDPFDARKKISRYVELEEIKDEFYIEPEDEYIRERMKYMNIAWEIPGEYKRRYEHVKSGYADYCDRKRQAWFESATMAKAKEFSSVDSSAT